MGKRFCILLILCVLVLGSASSSAAVTGHNLHWGFEVGDQFHYRCRGYTDLGDIYFYVEVDSLPAIPNDVSSLEDIASLNFSFYWEDGTETAFSFGWGAMPIGNWSLIQELFNVTAAPFDIQCINTFSEWGMKYTETYPTGETTNTVKFSKADGVVTLYRLVQDPTEGPTTTVEMTRGGVSSVLYQYIGIGAAVIALLAIAAVIIKRR